MRRLSQKGKVPFKRSRWLLLKNPWNLSDDQKERLSTLVRWNTPIVRAYYLKEAFQLFWDFRQPRRAGDHLEKWMRLCGDEYAAVRSRRSDGRFRRRDPADALASQGKRQRHTQESNPAGLGMKFAHGHCGHACIADQD